MTQKSEINQTTKELESLFEGAIKQYKANGGVQALNTSLPTTVSMSGEDLFMLINLVCWFLSQPLDKDFMHVVLQQPGAYRLMERVVAEGEGKGITKVVRQLTHDILAILQEYYAARENPNFQTPPIVLGEIPEDGEIGA